MATQTSKPRGKRGACGAGNEVGRLRAQVMRLPAPNADGNLPAEATLDIIIAWQIIRRRRAAGWSQAELATKAGIRQETMSRLESCKHAPTVTTVDKLDRALRAAGV